MKRLVSVVLVLLALGIAAFFFVRLRPFLPERSRAAELAPAETVFFAHFPNVRQTALRFLQTDLYQIWREPDVQAFLAKPRVKAPWLREWEERFDAALLAAPGEAFVAVTSLEGPQFVAGFAFAGSQRYAETLATNLRAKFAPQTVLAFHSNWVLLASDEASLKNLLARFDAKGGTSLATDPRFQTATADLGVERDLVVFGSAKTFDEILPVRASGSPSEESGAVAMATRIEGGRLHDTFSLPADPGEPMALSQKTLELAPARPLFYYAGLVGLLPPGMETLPGRLPQWPVLTKLLAERGLGWGDLARAIGPEVALIATWPEESAAPTLLLGAEIRDSEKARIFLKVVTDPAAFGAPWTAEDHRGVTLSIAPPEAFSLVRPSLALTDRFALVGLSAEAIVAAVSPKPSPSAEGTAPTFHTAVQTLPGGASGFGYVDLPRLFERVYRVARPFITLSFAFSEAGTQFDAGKLPPIESISRHLSPAVLSVTRTADRTTVESAGSLTVPELFWAVRAASAGGRLPELPGIFSEMSKPEPSAKSKPANPNVAAPKRR